MNNIMIKKENYDFYIAPCGCGGKAILYTDSCQYLVACTECGIETPYTEEKEEAVKIWNRAMNNAKNK